MVPTGPERARPGPGTAAAQTPPRSGGQAGGEVHRGPGAQLWKVFLPHPKQPQWLAENQSQGADDL